MVGDAAAVEECGRYKTLILGNYHIRLSDLCSY